MAFPAIANILIAVTFVSLVSFVGALILFLNVKRVKDLLFPMVAFAAGAMLGAAFFDLLPEALEQGEGLPVFPMILGGMVLFFVVEKLLYWYHCHSGKCEVHQGRSFGHTMMVKPVATLNLLGDGAHNFLDGAIIAAGFLQSFDLGIIITIAVILHEIPQEIGDFMILIYAGMTKGKALFFNFLTALTAIVGALVAFFFAETFVTAQPIMLSFAAGGFIYIAAADLIPELHHDQKYPRSLIQLAWFGLGILVMYLVSFYFAV